MLDKKMDHFLLDSVTFTYFLRLERVGYLLENITYSKAMGANVAVAVACI